jgi:hypothetical protein
MEMVLPSNYIDVEQEEMMYMDGGAIGTDGLSICWWGYQVRLSGTTLKKIFQYSIDGIIGGAGGVIAAALGCTAIVAAAIGLSIAVSITVIKIIHDDYHGVSFNKPWLTNLVVPWRQ